MRHDPASGAVAESRRRRGASDRCLSRLAYASSGGRPGVRAPRVRQARDERCNYQRGSQCVGGGRPERQSQSAAWHRRARACVRCWAHRSGRSARMPASCSRSRWMTCSSVSALAQTATGGYAAARCTPIAFSCVLVVESARADGDRPDLRGTPPGCSTTRRSAGTTSGTAPDGPVIRDAKGTERVDARERFARAIATRAGWARPVSSRQGAIGPGASHSPGPATSPRQLDSFACPPAALRGKDAARSPAEHCLQRVG